jgi:hypothetical protein
MYHDAAERAACCPTSHTGRKVWHLRVDVHVLDHQGALVDACGLAALAALMAFRRPDVTVGGDDGQVLASLCMWIGLLSAAGVLSITDTVAASCSCTAPGCCRPSSCTPAS